MTNYTEFFPYFVELDKICEGKKLNDITIRTLRKWFLSILFFYKSKDNILDNFSLEDYIKNIFEKLKQTDNIKILSLERILNDNNCALYKCIKKIPFDIVEIKTRLSKKEECFILDKNGEYYLSASGVCCGGKTIELLDEIGSENVLQHELQHINQNYVYPSEFPFANDMLKMLNEGEAEYHYHFLNMSPTFFSNKTVNPYYIYYLLYTLLMLIIPKEMRDSWSTSKVYGSYIFSDIFKYITDSEVSRKQFSYIFTLMTIITAYCNSENTKEVFFNSVNTSLDRCSEKLQGWNRKVQIEIESDRKNILDNQKKNIELVTENIKILQNSDLLKEKYLQIINDEKEFIINKPKEEQEELLHELQLFTLQKFKSMLNEDIKNGKENILKYQNKKDKSLQEILGDENYHLYQFYQFGFELSKKMQELLKEELTFTELFEQLLNAVKNYLIENKVSRLEEKIDFIDEIKNNSLINFKKI